MKIAAIIVAGGGGRRMGEGENKLFIPLAGVPLLARTISVFERHSRIEAIAVVLNKEIDERFRREILKPFRFTKITQLPAGGRRRQDSVYNGLVALADQPEKVLIHDGGRPFVEINTIDRILDAVASGVGAVAAVRPRDTIKTVDDEGSVEETLDRNLLRLIQTPQGFIFRDILAAHRQAREEGWEVTDDAAVLERAGGRILTVMGGYDNIKITVPEDILLARNIARNKWESDKK